MTKKSREEIKKERLIKLIDLYINCFESIKILDYTFEKELSNEYRQKHHIDKNGKKFFENICKYIDVGRKDLSEEEQKNLYYKMINYRYNTTTYNFLCGCLGIQISSLLEILETLKKKVEALDKVLTEIDDFDKNYLNKFYRFKLELLGK